MVTLSPPPDAFGGGGRPRPLVGVYATFGRALGGDDWLGVGGGLSSAVGALKRGRAPQPDRPAGRSRAGQLCAHARRANAALCSRHRVSVYGPLSNRAVRLVTFTARVGAREYTRTSGRISFRLRFLSARPLSKTDEITRWPTAKKSK